MIDSTPNNDLADVFFEIEVASLEQVQFVVDLEGVVVKDSLLGFVILCVNYFTLQAKAAQQVVSDSLHLECSGTKF